MSLLNLNSIGDQLPTYPPNVQGELRVILQTKDIFLVCYKQLEEYRRLVNEQNRLITKEFVQEQLQIGEDEISELKMELQESEKRLGVRLHHNELLADQLSKLGFGSLESGASVRHLALVRSPQMRKNMLAQRQTGGENATSCGRPTTHMIDNIALAISEIHTEVRNKVKPLLDYYRDLFYLQLHFTLILSQVCNYTMPLVTENIGIIDRIFFWSERPEFDLIRRSGDISDRLKEIYTRAQTILGVLTESVRFLQSKVDLQKSLETRFHERLDEQQKTKDKILRDVHSTKQSMDMLEEENDRLVGSLVKVDPNFVDSKHFVELAEGVGLNVKAAATGRPNNSNTEDVNVNNKTSTSTMDRSNSETQENQPPPPPQIKKPLKQKQVYSSNNSNQRKKSPKCKNSPLDSNSSNTARDSCARLESPHASNDSYSDQEAADLNNNKALSVCSDLSSRADVVTESKRGKKRNGEKRGKHGRKSSAKFGMLNEEEGEDDYEEMEINDEVSIRSERYPGKRKSAHHKTKLTDSSLDLVSQHNARRGERSAKTHKSKRSHSLSRHRHDVEKNGDGEEPGDATPTRHHRRNGHRDSSNTVRRSSSIQSSAEASPNAVGKSGSNVEKSGKKKSHSRRGHASSKRQVKRAQSCAPPQSEESDNGDEEDEAVERGEDLVSEMSDGSQTARKSMRDMFKKKTKNILGGVFEKTKHDSNTSASSLASSKGAVASTAGSTTSLASSSSSMAEPSPLLLPHNALGPENGDPFSSPFGMVNRDKKGRKSRHQRHNNERESARSRRNRHKAGMVPNDQLMNQLPSLGGDSTSSFGTGGGSEAPGTALSSSGSSAGTSGTLADFLAGGSGLAGAGSTGSGGSNAIFRKSSNSHASGGVASNNLLDVSLSSDLDHY